ncbi:MAG: polysaccharide pyruvyl transferase family protein, partial [Armatimonadota bacterium]
IRAIADADLVVMRGGGYLSSPNIVCDLWGLRLNSLSEIAIARSLGVPYAIWGHTIWGLEGPLGKRVLWPLIRDSAVTVCREQRSYDYLASEGAPTDRLAVLPDTAFAVTPASDERVDQIMKREGLLDVTTPLFGANASPIWTNEGAGCPSESAYVSAFSNSLQHAAESLQFHPVLILHGYSTEQHDLPRSQDDRRVASRVAEAMDIPCTIVERQYTPSDLVGLYGRFEAMVTTRLHAGILSAAAGTPSAFIAYEKNKTYGIAKILGLDRWVTDIETITEDRLREVIGSLWRTRDDLPGELDWRLREIRGRLSAYGELTREGMARGSRGANR